MATNDGGHVTQLFVGTTEAEMEALDALGPLTRRAICESPIRISAQPILQQLQEFEQKQLVTIPVEVRHLYRLNFSEPRLDQFVAAGITEDSRQKLLKDCAEVDANAGVIPLVPRISVKSIREQRRSARRIRW
jgi:hypothetical protein